MMELPKATHRLIKVLEEQQPLMRDLLEAMQRERSSFIAARPSILERIQEKLLPIADRLAELEAERRAIVDHVQEALNLRGELSVSRLASKLKDPLASKLVRAAERTAELAKALRVEQTVGSQLLNFSHQAQEGMYRNLMGLEDSTAPGYDRSARTIKDSPGSGQLISGLI